jgi:hypothetical protein
MNNCNFILSLSLYDINNLKNEKNSLIRLPYYGIYTTSSKQDGRDL